MNDLIAALESAQEGSLELDDRVHALLLDVLPSTAKAAREAFGELTVPRYTTSLDAALTLVDGDRWTVYSGPARAVVGLHDGHNGATPALALCIAALKARRK